MGLRTSKTKAGNTTRFTWDASGVPLLLSEGGTSYRYDADGLPLERIDSNGGVVFFHHDQLGSSRMLTDDEGAVVGTYTYDAYGSPTASTGSVTTPFGYAGEYTDADTGMIYLRARYYDPATGQFLTRDPLEDLSGQPYVYAGGDPINSIDPLGLWPSLSEIGMGISSGAAGVLDGVSGGLSTTLAGKVFGFDVECADFGTTFDVTSVIAANTPWGRVGKGVRGIRAIKGAKGAKGAVPAVARTQPQNLAEKLALDEAMGGAGTRIMKGKINDPRYPEDVWAKMQHVHENPGGTKTVIHYWENLQTGAREGLKFK